MDVIVFTDGRNEDNGISLDNWQPELSRIPGVRKYAETFGREIPEA